MSTSPFLSAAARVVSSGRLLSTSRLTLGHLAPETFERLEHQLDAGGEAHELVRPGADRRLLEAVVADLLDIGFGHDPGGTGGRGAVERHEVRPRLLQVQAHAARVHDLDLAHALLEDLRPGALVALERELHVGGGDRLAVMELRILANDELVGEPVLRLRERLREARRVEPGRHRLHQRVVQGVEHHERRGDALGLAGVEPARGQRDVDAPGHGAFGRRDSLARKGAQNERNEDDNARGERPHWRLPVDRSRKSLTSTRKRTAIIPSESSERGVTT